MRNEAEEAIVGEMIRWGKSTCTYMTVITAVKELYPLSHMPVV